MMPTDAYEDILRRARSELSAEERLRLINDLSVHPGTTTASHSICELEGLGKHIWEGLDADEYVRKERDAWSG